MERSKIDASERSRLDFCDEIIRMLTVTSMETNDTIRIIDQCSNIDFTPGFDYSNEKLDAKTSKYHQDHNLIFQKCINVI